MGGKCRSRLLAASCSLPLKIRLLTDACGWHCSHTARVNVPAQLLDGGEDLRCFLAGVLRGDALKKFCVSFGPASPRILRHGPALPRRPYRYTEVLPRIPCPPALLAPPCTGPIRTGPTCQRPLGTTLKLVVAPLQCW